MTAGTQRIRLYKSITKILEGSIISIDQLEWSIEVNTFSKDRLEWSIKVFTISTINYEEDQSLFW